MSDVEFEQRVVAALRADVRTDVRTEVSAESRARSRIMERVRAAARQTPRSRDLVFRRGARHSIVGLALAAGVGSITTLSTLLPADASPGASSSVVIGDSVVSTLRDTLRLVRLMFHGPAARQVAVVGDFNGWRADSTPLAREDRTGRWSATLALHDGDHRFAFVVDGTRWVPDPSGRRVRTDDGRVFSILHVAPTTH